MIPLSDLRLGNIFLHGGKIEKIVDYISFTNTYHYEPIKLTPEILEQIATKFNGFDIAYFNDNFTIRHIGEFGWHTIDSLGRMDKHVEYLHDLQNIYYYENNKRELPININTLKI